MRSARRAALLFAFLAVSLLAAASSAPPRDAPPAQADAGWRYAVVALEGARVLEVDATFRKGSPARLGVDDGAGAFVRDLELLEGNPVATGSSAGGSGPGGDAVKSPWRRIERAGDAWSIPACHTHGCRIRYRFDLARAAARLGDLDYAMRHGEVFLGSLSSWLVHPLNDAPEIRVHLQVTTPPGLSFVTGLAAAPGQPAGAYLASAGDFPDVPYAAIGPLRRHRVETGGTTLEVAIAPGELELADPALTGWVRRSADLVSLQHGRFPVPGAAVILLPARGDDVPFGATIGNGGASVVAWVGRTASQADLLDDWILPHELIHLGLPSLAKRHQWLEEGFATYYEPVLRARHAGLEVSRVWERFLYNMPKGLPRAGDRGLDRTPTWGRTYWGGALFCLLADLEIRHRTGDRRSLDDVTRAITQAGGSIAVRWSIDRVIEVGDRATGVPVLRELYRKHGLEPGEVDLEALWKRLGVRWQGRRVVFDDRAPWAGIRRSITQKPPDRRSSATAPPP